MTQPYDPNNIFAKILRGEAPCVRVSEDDVSLAFMDIMPRADGHALVVPKTPARNLLDIAPADLARFIPVGAAPRARRQGGHGGRRRCRPAVQRERRRTARLPPAFPRPAALGRRRAAPARRPDRARPTSSKPTPPRFAPRCVASQRAAGARRGRSARALHPFVTPGRLPRARPGATRPAAPRIPMRPTDSHRPHHRHRAVHGEHGRHGAGDFAAGDRARPASRTRSC